MTLDALPRGQDGPHALFRRRDRRRAGRIAPSSPGAATILTGPEGGFTDEERAADPRRCRTRSPISLGPRILRAETAALAALAAYMALAGDWR